MFESIHPIVTHYYLSPFAKGDGSGNEQTYTYMCFTQEYHVLFGLHWRNDSEEDKNVKCLRTDTCRRLVIRKAHLTHVCVLAYLYKAQLLKDIYFIIFINFSQPTCSTHR